MSQKRFIIDIKYRCLKHVSKTFYNRTLNIDVKNMSQKRFIITLKFRNMSLETGKNPEIVLL